MEVIRNDEGYYFIDGDSIQPLTDLLLERGVQGTMKFIDDLERGFRRQISILSEIKGLLRDKKQLIAVAEKHIENSVKYSLEGDKYSAMVAMESAETFLCAAGMNMEEVRSFIAKKRSSVWLR